MTYDSLWAVLSRRKGGGGDRRAVDLLVLRELVAGARFNDLHHDVSRTLLSKRLTQLINDGLVERRDTPDGPVYELAAGGGGSSARSSR